MRRCEWARTELYIAYHDREWGVPIHDDRDLFEFLILEGMQAGLSWETILRKRDNYRAAFDNFEVSVWSMTISYIASGTKSCASKVDRNRNGSNRE
jgi:3-methyladenine DNA glycosylase Tag